MKTIFYLLSFLFLFFPMVWASMIFYESVTLKDLIRQSSLILVVEKSQDWEIVTDIPVRCLFPKNKPYPFARRRHQYYVTEIIKDTGGSQKDLPGKKVMVESAKFEQKEELHRSYICKGTSKSPVFERYDSDLQPEKSEKFIVFLYVYKGVYSYTVDGAWEDISRIDEIKSLVKE